MIHAPLRVMTLGLARKRLRASPSVGLMIAAGNPLQQDGNCAARFSDQMSEPRWVPPWACVPMAVVTTTTVIQWCGCDRIVPADVCARLPPTAEALIYGIIQLQKNRRTNTIACA